MSYLPPSRLAALRPVVALCLLTAACAVLLPTASAISVREFGAVGDGVADDTAALEAAVRGASDGVVDFPRGRYRITRPVEVRLAAHGPLGLSGRGGSATVVMAGPGPAFLLVGSHDRGTADPKSVKPITWERERLPTLDGLEIVGAHPEADGVHFRDILQPVVRGLLVRQVRHALRLSGRSRNVLIDGVHLYDCSGIGVFLDALNLHQINIGDSHISYCRQGGIKVVGSEIRNFQITGNDIEYNFAADGPPAADIWFDLAAGGSIREGTISGNTVQALPSRGGANIRFTGIAGQPHKVGVWSITGNHLANQETIVHLRDAAGVTLTGNTFLRGYHRQLVVEGCRNVIVNGNVFDRNADYFPPGTKAPGGVVIERSTGVIFSDNLVEGAESGTAESGGAISVTDCRDVTLSANQVRNPAVRGLHIARSTNVRVSDTLVSQEPGKERMLSAVMLEGPCPGTVVRGNTLERGSQGAVVNRASGARVEEPGPR